MSGFTDLEIKSNSKYFKVKAGEPHDARVLSETPSTFMVHQGPQTTIPCNGGICTYCAKGAEVKQRFKANVYDHNSQKVLLWEFGTMVAKQLRSLAKTLAEEGKTLLDVDVKVEVSGSGLDTKYMVTPRMTSKEIPKGLKLHPLSDEGIPF